MREDYTIEVVKTMNRRKALVKAKKLGIGISSFNNVNLYTLEMMYENCHDFQLFINDGVITATTRVMWR